MYDAVIILPQALIASGHDDLAEEIARQFKRATFRRRLLLRRHLKRTLHIHFPKTGIHHEVDFITLANALAFRILLNALNDAYIDGMSSAPQITVQNVLHQMSAFHLTKIEPSVSEPDIFCVELRRRAQVFPPLHVPTFSTFKQEGLSKILKIIAQCVTVFSSSK